MSLNRSNMYQILLWSFTILESHFVASFLNMIHPFWICTFCAPFLLDPYISTDFSESQCTAPSAYRSSWSKWRTIFDANLEICGEKRPSNIVRTSWNDFPNSVLSKNSLLRKIHWFLFENDRILFQLAGTWRINSAWPIPKASFVNIGIIFSFRVCLLLLQFTAGNIVTDIGIFRFIHKSVFPLVISVKSNNKYDFDLNDWPNFSTTNLGSRHLFLFINPLFTISSWGDGFPASSSSLAPYW